MPVAPLVVNNLKTARRSRMSDADGFVRSNSVIKV
jgi:hypothetical protein